MILTSYTTSHPRPLSAFTAAHITSTSHQRPKRTIRRINRAWNPQTLWAPMACFCHAAVPCGACEECGDDKETECYYTWVFCNAAAFQVLTARDGGTKFTNEGPGCCECGEYELEEAADGGGTPQSVEMQRA